MPKLKKWHFSTKNRPKSPKIRIFLLISIYIGEVLCEESIGGVVGVRFPTRRPRRDANTQKMAFFNQKSTKIAQNSHFFAKLHIHRGSFMRGIDWRGRWGAFPN